MAPFTFLMPICFLLFSRRKEIIPINPKEAIKTPRMVKIRTSLLNHEVMNSITPIRTFSHVINRSIQESGLDRQADPHVRNTINDIHKNTGLIEERSSGLIEFIKRYSEITKIRELEKTEVSVNKLFNEVVSLFKNDFLTYKIDCRITIDPVDLSLECDINLLKQVKGRQLKSNFKYLHHD